MSRKVFKYSAVIASLLMTAVFAGCGTSNKEGNIVGADVAKVSESACAQCHSTAIDHIAGTKIYEAYLASNHFITGKAGCQDCHGGGSQHNGVGPLPYPNPDTAGKCYSCHKDYLKYEFGHFFNYTAATNKDRPAVYASLNYQTSCTSCHDPHLAENGVRDGKLSTVTTGTLIAGQAKGTEHKDWAETAGGHGDVIGAAFAHYDFKTMDNCNRCHTSTGFLNAVNSSFAYPAPAWGVAGDKTKEVITCKVCHTDYNFKNRVRSLGAFTAPYNGNKSPKTFPDASTSNLCVSCHSGLESGDSVAAVTDFTNANFKNSHYLPAAGFTYMTIGFTSFTSASAKAGVSSTGTAFTYGDSYTMYYGSGTTPAGQVSSTHRKLGTSLIVGDHGIAAGSGLDSTGPCVICHLKGGNTTRTTSHTLSATSAGATLSATVDTGAYAQVCAKCHTYEAGTLVNADGSNFATVFIEPNKSSFNDALALAAAYLQTNFKIKYDSANYPYFFDLTADPTGKTAVTDWTRKTNNQAFGKKVMGACFNLQALTKDPGAFAHGRTYARRLVYDTIDFLDDGIMNTSVSALAQVESARAGSPVFGKFTKGAAAYTGSQNASPGSPLAAGTTEGMVYLIGWSRSTGAWSTPERP